ncbi:pteridine reductase [Lacimicrobium alkaliphilum]|uniref:Pteridine reductase n=1 Tax=Lacimicrobium alkaliphilum TaxID=1526571 RepID=A0A0U3AKA1_9ALTE|nr:pteridine reductase [Lacimicrobium alkaliphilum]ALS98402.1 pteridine reductase [Lacimicrobium alkaliphilum]
MQDTQKVIFISGSAKRLGAAIARFVHQQGYRVVLHCQHSLDEAKTLQQTLNARRRGSAALVSGDLCEHRDLSRLAEEIPAAFGRLDGLINNASAFYPTPIGQIKQQDWHTLMGSNAMAPLFLSQALSDELKSRQGTIINMADIHALRPLPAHSVYCMAKSALVSMTESLAVELAPDIRVNAIAPGAILWPSKEISEQEKSAVLAKVPLQRMGGIEDITGAVGFLLNAAYVTGQILKVDGGRSLAGNGPL